ncbi:sialidase family protein [Fodinicola feengrottensis]|uniref:exo-alpha-sialidase n=1 Tax=Fodinicola feengrottensis TaxID=435914 RepID=A0ABN2FY27_9ACTN|nr:sialidase family protein [Fodinicola feengrottensis]
MHRKFWPVLGTFAGVAGVIAAATLLPTAIGALVAQSPAARCSGAVPYKKGDGGYNTFRIPAVVKARNGMILAFAEGRKDSGGDSGNIDIVLRRSGDGGCTWGPLQVVADQGTDTIGNPAPVVTNTGRIVLLSVHNGGSVTEAQIIRGQVSAADTRRPFVQYSDDNGATWSALREITAQAKKPDWRWYATTPGHALQISRGPHAGRLVVAANHTTTPGTTDTGAEGKYNSGHDIYSDDLGQTWHIGYIDENPDGFINVNESTATELPDGRLYFNTRNDATAPGHRADAYSSDGGQTLDKPFPPNDTIVAAISQGSVLQLSQPDLLLFSGPYDPNNKRAAMSLQVSRDQGVNFTLGLTLSGLPAAYSDLVQVDQKTVAVLYETGDFSAYENITFTRVPISRLSS